MNVLRTLIAKIAFFGAIGTSAFADEKPPWPPNDAAFEKYLAGETDKLSKKFLDGATTLEQWKAKRSRLHQEYLYSLGLWPLPEKTPLKVTFTGKTIEHEGILIDKLHYQSKPGLYVTANLYRPKGTEQAPKASKKKHPAVLYVCGHSGRGRSGNKTAFQDHGIWFASHGYVCLIVDTLQLGEIPAVHHGTYGRPWNHLRSYGIKDAAKQKEGTRWWWHSRGYTPAGVECWNGIRGIDYLVSRADVDAKKIAVTGISGGGAATFWIAAADERVACAVPVSGMSDLESYVKNKVINGHCDCMFLYNTFGWDWTTIAALVAPRPLLFANSDNDRIFPMDGNRRIIKKLRGQYKLYGKPDLVDEYVSEGGHAYRPDLRLAIFKWINKHVKGDTGPIESSEKYKMLPGETLRVFASVDDVPKDEINSTIDETFVPTAKVQLPKKDEFPAWRKQLIGDLRKHALRNIPEKLPTAKRAKNSPFAMTANLETEPGIIVGAMQAGFPKNADDPQTMIVFAPKDEKELLQLYPESLQAYTGSAIVLWPRIGWTPKSPPNYVERSHVLLGRTVDEGRVRDVIAAWRYARSKMHNLQRIVGVGRDGILAAYAALLEPSIKEVVIIDPPTSHKDGPYFLNVMRVLDVPEALGMLAPRKLTLVNAKDKAFERTAEIYKIAGAADKLTRK